MATKKQPREPNLPRLFLQLQLAGEDGDHEKGLKISEKILSISPGDPDALHCKLVCLTHLSKFQEANKLIDSFNKKSEKPQFLFEKAYCLYRLEKYAESQKLLARLPKSEVRVQELQAQILYRLEQYSEAKSVYADLVKECSDGFTSEREANFAAAQSYSVDHLDGGSQLESLPSDTMEQSFNAACCYLAVGRPRDAERALETAEQQCRESLLEEGYTDEEIESEMSVVRVQVGYALQLQDRNKEAMLVYNAILKQKPDDVSQLVLTSNNVIVLNKDRDIFDSKKKAKILANEGTSKKLTSFQKLLVLFNRCLFALQTNQLDQCRELVGKLESTKPSHDLTILAKVALLNRERKVSSCIECLDSHLRSNQKSNVVLYTTLAQLYLSQGHQDKVCAVLRLIPSLPRYLGVVSVLVSLYNSSGDVDNAVCVLDEAVVFWTKQEQSESNQTVVRSLMMESAKFKLQNCGPQSAAIVLEKLHTQYPSDLKVIAMLISAYSRYDAKKAEELSCSLAEFKVSQPVDVDALEQMPSFRHSRRQQQKPDVKEQVSTDKKQPLVKAKKKKKRKPRLPKNYDPAVAPDPERWLPLRERSYYRKGRKMGYSATARGTQGTSAASASLMAQLDASKPKATPTSEESELRNTYVP